LRHRNANELAIDNSNVIAAAHDSCFILPPPRPFVFLGVDGKSVVDLDLFWWTPKKSAQGACRQQLNSRERTKELVAIWISQLSKN